MILTGDFNEAVAQATRGTPQFDASKRPRSARNRQIAGVYRGFNEQDARQTIQRAAQVLGASVTTDRRLIAFLIEGLKTPDFSLSRPFADALADTKMSRDEKLQLIEELADFEKTGWSCARGAVEQTAESFADDPEMIKLMDAAGFSASMRLAAKAQNARNRSEQTKKSNAVKSALREKLEPLPKDKHILMMMENRVEFESILAEEWETLISDSRFKSMIEKTWHVPPPILVKSYLNILKKVYEFVLLGQPHNLDLNSNIVATHATVHLKHLYIDGEGPTYIYTYAFTDLVGETHLFEGQGDYDGMGMAIEGWATDALRKYSGDANQIRCHFDRNQPNNHKIYLL